MHDDVQVVDGVSTGVIITLIVLPLVIYLGLNILGTIYYAKLSTKDVSGGAKAVSLVTVILGWMGAAILNITSPIVYASSPDKINA
jgi:hypothetical protein